MKLIIDIDENFYEMVKRKVADGKHRSDRCWEIIAKGVPEREKRDWIPITERLPKDDEDVLVYCGQFSGQGIMNIAYYHSDYTFYPSEYADLNETGWYDKNDDAMYHEPIAWMPLPDPYKAERGEQK